MEAIVELGGLRPEPFIPKALPFLNVPASIIFNGSVNALTGIANSSLYTANKGAIQALARAAELIGRGIRVNTITIGPTATRLLARSGSSQAILDAQDVARISRSPVKRLGRPEEVANVAILFLLPKQDVTCNIVALPQSVSVKSGHTDYHLTHMRARRNAIREGVPYDHSHDP